MRPMFRRSCPMLASSLLLTSTESHKIEPAADDSGRTQVQPT